jgi:hypothetical protein
MLFIRSFGNISAMNGIAELYFCHKSGIFVVAPTKLPDARRARDFHQLFIAAWLLCAVFYFIQYALRSAPGVMVPELTAAWNLNALTLSSLLGLYFFTYASFALIAGASLDRYGAKWTIPAGIACLAAGTVLFGWGTVTEAHYFSRTRSVPPERQANSLTATISHRSRSTIP